MNQPNQVAAPDLVTYGPERCESLSTVQLVKSSKDWSFFSLAAIYAAMTYQGKCYLDFELTSQFKQEFPSATIYKYAYEKPVARFTFKDSHTIYAINNEAFPEFNHWLMLNSFMLKQEHGWPCDESFTVRNGKFHILDKPGGSKLADVIIYLPESTRTKCSPVVGKDSLLEIYFVRTE